MRGKGLREHNNSFSEKSSYINYMTKHIISTEIRKFSKNFCKEAARSKKIESSALETKLKILEPKIRYRDDPEYIHCKEELDKIYQGKINGALIRSKLDCMSMGKNRQSFS